MLESGEHMIQSTKAANEPSARGLKCAIVGTFNQEKALIGRDLLRDHEHACGPSFSSLLPGAAPRCL